MIMIIIIVVIIITDFQGAGRAEDDCCRDEGRGGEPSEEEGCHRVGPADEHHDWSVLRQHGRHSPGRRQETPNPRHRRPRTARQEAADAG